MANAALKIQEEVTEVVDAVVVEDATTGVNELDELDAMFAELDGVGEIAIETPESELNEADMLEAGHAAAIHDAKIEAFAELDEMSEPVPDNSTLATGVEEAQAKRKAPVTRRISSHGLSKSQALAAALGTKINDYLVLSGADAGLDEAAMQASVEAKLVEIDTLPVKIQEKVVNFFAHLANGAALSNYTRMAIELLVKNGELSSKQLRDAYLARPYSLGTANSQCTQMMKLLPVLGLAKRQGAVLVADSDSTLLPMFATE